MQDIENIISNLIQKKRKDNEFCVLTPENSLHLVSDFIRNLQNNSFITLNPYSSNQKGEVIFLEAPTGSGKDNLFLQLSFQNPDKKYVELNMDMFRKYYSLFIPNYKELNDIDFAKLTNQFSYEIFLLIQEILLDYYPGANIIISGTLREIDWNEKLMRRYKSDKKTEYTLKLISLAIPKKEGLYSVIKRYIYIVESSRRFSDFTDGTARYTTSEYFNETYDKFIKNFEYFVNMYKVAPGEIIDSIEVYRRNRSLKDFKDDNLVYSSDREEDANNDPISVIKELREKDYSIPTVDAIEIQDLIKANTDYLLEQNTYRDIVETLASLLNCKKYNPEEPDLNISVKLSDLQPVQ